MSDLRVLYVFLTTSSRADANTDSRIRLVYENGARREFELGDLPHDERERGRTDLYELEFPISVEIEEVRPEHFKLVAAGDDAWLPSSVFIIGKSRTSEFRVIVGQDRWPTDAWLSTQLSDANGRAAKARLLDRRATPTTA